MEEELKKELRAQAQELTRDNARLRSILTNLGLGKGKLYKGRKGVESSGREELKA